MERDCTGDRRWNEMKCCGTILLDNATVKALCTSQSHLNAYWLIIIKSIIRSCSWYWQLRKSQLAYLRCGCCTCVWLVVAVSNGGGDGGLVLVDRMISTGLTRLWHINEFTCHILRNITRMYYLLIAIGKWTFGVQPQGLAAQAHRIISEQFWEFCRFTY